MADKNCWICNEGIGRSLCVDHRADVLANITSDGTELPVGATDDSALVDLCRAICLAPLGVY